jgi:HSP20 family protein
MKLTNLRPSDRLVTARDDVERVFDRFLSTWPFHPGSRDLGEPWAPDLDFTETDKEYVVRLEVPGVPKENIQVEINARTVFISGYREVTEEERDENVFRRERNVGRFTRSLELPMPVDAARVTATATDGVLTVRLPKGEAGFSTKVEVK